MVLTRLKEYIDFKGISIAKFESEIGMSNNSFRKSWLNKGSIGSDKLENILRKYPDINTEWLLTGKGEMLLRQPSEQGDQSNDWTDYKEKYLRLLEQHTELQSKYAAFLEEREKKSYATHRVGAAGVAAAGG